MATGEFGDERNASGWARLTLQTNPVYEDDIAVYGAGYLEGVVTAEMIWENWYNLVQSSFGGVVPAALQSWFRSNLAWMQQQVSLYAASQPYWRHVELLLLQLRGIHQGYSSVFGNSTERALPFDAFILLNSDGDMEEICVVPFPSPAALQGLPLMSLLRSLAVQVCLACSDARPRNRPSRTLTAPLLCASRPTCKSYMLVCCTRDVPLQPSSFSSHS